MSGHYSYLVCRARFQSMGQLLARCVLIDRCHVDLKRGDTTYRSLVDMEWRKHTGRLATVRFFSLSGPSCSVFSSSLAADDSIRGWALPTLLLLNHVVVLPSRLHPNHSAPVVIVSLATSLRDRNTFKQLVSESCCVVESLYPRASEPSEPCVLIDGSSSCLSAHVQLNILSFHHIRVNTLLARAVVDITQLALSQPLQ